MIRPFHLQSWQSQVQICARVIKWGLMMCLTVHLATAQEAPTLVIEVNGTEVNNYNILAGTVFTARCIPVQPLVGSDSHHHFRRDNLDMGMFYTDEYSQVFNLAQTVTYSCLTALAINTNHSAWSNQITVIVYDACSPKPCQNDHPCIVVTPTVYDCQCRQGYAGTHCEQVLAISEINSWDPVNEQEAVSTIDTVLKTSSSLLTSDVATVGITSVALNATLYTLDTVVGKLLNTSYQSTGLTAMITDIVGFADDVYSALDGAQCSMDQTLCQSQSLDTVYKSLETSLFNLSMAILDAGATGMTTMQRGNLTLQTRKLLITSRQRLSINTEGGAIEVTPMFTPTATTTAAPSSWWGSWGRRKRSTNSLNVMAITYNTNTYSHSTTPLTPDGKVINFKIQDDAGQDIPLSLGEPMTLTLTPLSDPTANVNASNSYNISLNGISDLDILVLELDLSDTETVTLKGRIRDMTLGATPDLELKASKSQRITEVVNSLALNFTMALTPTGATVKVFGKNLTNYGSYMTVTIKYEGSTSTSSKAIQAYLLTVVAWDPANLYWYTPTGLHAQLAQDSGVTFSSNFFGSFSVSRVFISPVPIDFDEIFGDFSENVQDSPYVLAVICTIAGVSLLLLPYLRRLDVTDRSFWIYLPLVDNCSEQDTWLYTLSVHTAFGSPRSPVSSQPYFILSGEHRRTHVRILSDGVRKNFVRATVSNFVMTSPVWLGDLDSIQIWTDGQGQQPDWLLERIVVVDTATNRRYIFLSQDWFSPTKGTGQLCQCVPVLPQDTAAGHRGTSLVSKENLYNEHLWLSVTCRSSYSTFTRVQRFLTALALLYLAMLTNAMFYLGSDSSDDDAVTTQTTGLKLGPLTVGYREVYVGVVSGVIIVVPGFLLSWLFSHRKLRGFSYPDEKNETEICPTERSHDMNMPAQQEGSTARSDSKICLEETSTSDSTDLIKAVFSSILPNRSDYKSSFEGDQQVAEPQRTDIHSQPERGRHLLPWWTVLIGYGLIGAIMAVSVTLTFFYSLQWGGSTSLEWLLSLVFSTSSSFFIIDPLKFLLISLLLGCLFSNLVATELSKVAPYEQKDVKLSPLAAAPPVVGPPEVDSKTMSKRKRELQVRQRFHDLMRSIGFRLVMLVVVAISCFHNDVNLAFHQNQILQRIWNNGSSKQLMYSQSDIWTWLRHTTVPNVLPVTLVTGQPMTPYQRTFTVDQAHYRLGPLRILQFRVQDKCDTDMGNIDKALRSVKCRVDYSVDDEETRSFNKGWVPCNGSSCNQLEFVYSQEDRYSLPQEGDITYYGPGGYQALLTTNQPLSLATLSDLEAAGWIDHLTRAILVQLTVFNANTRLFTQTEVLLETPSVGGILTTIKVQSARLYPYTTVWDYLVLAAQLVFVVIVVLRTGMLVSAVVSGQAESRCSLSRLVTALELLLSWTCIVVFIVRIHYTIEVIERINNHPGEHTSFDLVFMLDEVYVVSIAILLYLRILLCLEPLKLNVHLYVMRQTLSSAGSQLAGYGLLLVILLTAFASFFCVTRGPFTENLKNLTKSYISLLTVLLGHGKYRIVGGQADGAEVTGVGEVMFRFMYGCYCLGAAITMVNIAVTILTTYLTDVKTNTAHRSPRGGGFDRQLNKYLWKRVDQLLKAVFSPNAVDAAIAVKGNTQYHKEPLAQDTESPIGHSEEKTVEENGEQPMTTLLSHVA